MRESLPIGHVARQSGVKIATIRYYEQIGLLPEAARTEAGRRQYGDGDVRRLAFIRHARDLGFEIDAIRALLTLQDQPARSCAEADAIASAHLEEVQHRIDSLTALKNELELMIDGCRHGRLTDCNVIGVLADHDRCAHARH